MRTFIKWLVKHGPALATALDVHRDAICAQAASQLALEFPRLCADSERADQAIFQRMTFQKTPQRLHTVMQTALRFRTLGVIEREYRWFWETAPRFGVTREHMLSMARAYFAAARQSIPAEARIYPVLDECELAVLELIHDATADKLALSC